MKQSVQSEQSEQSLNAHLPLKVRKRAVERSSVDETDSFGRSV